MLTFWLYALTKAVLVPKSVLLKSLNEMRLYSPRLQSLDRLLWTYRDRTVECSPFRSVRVPGVNILRIFFGIVQHFLTKLFDQLVTLFVGSLSSQSENDLVTNFSERFVFDFSSGLGSALVSVFGSAALSVAALSVSDLAGSVVGASALGASDFAGSVSFAPSAFAGAFEASLPALSAFGS